MHDSASSASSSSPPPLRHRLRRTRSPSPPRPVPRAYSPASREADIARLLDPAYASPSPNSPLARSPRMAPKEVYVDHHGDLHDPDFRDFPPFGHSHTHHPRRPRWECDDTIDPDDDDDDDTEEGQTVYHRPSFEQRRRPSSSTTYHPPPVYYPYEEPASYESRFLAEDDDEDAEEPVHAPLKEKLLCGRPRSPTKRQRGQSEKRPPFVSGTTQVIDADSEWTPTCTQSLRRQWQAVTLSLRFSLFRTKRRLRRRLTG